MEKQITLKELTKVIKFAPFLVTYTGINPQGGINHRINGKGTGKTSKTKEMTNEDKSAITEGLRKLSTDIDAVIESLKVLDNDKV